MFEFRKFSCYGKNWNMYHKCLLFRSFPALWLIRHFLLRKFYWYRLFVSNSLIMNMNLFTLHIHDWSVRDATSGRLSSACSKFYPILDFTSLNVRLTNDTFMSLKPSDSWRKPLQSTKKGSTIIYLHESRLENIFKHNAVKWGGPNSLALQVSAMD